MRKKSKKKPNIINLILLVILLGGLGYGGYKLKPNIFKNNPETTQSSQTAHPSEETINPKKNIFKIFNAEEFRDLYNNFAFPNTRYISQNSIITGSEKADLHIQKLAEERGYLRRSAPVSDNFVVVQAPDYSLQRLAANDWKLLVESAKNDGVNLALTAAYRSEEDQKKIFLSRLDLSKYSPVDIELGRYDSEINQILATTAIPGYSRHHTGYTVDITCLDQQNTAFQFTTCYEWLEKDNYKNAKTHGWIPSYPEGAKSQGPEPESWEYVWVGTDATFE